jgi:hypothetical protein
MEVELLIFALKDLTQYDRKKYNLYIVDSGGGI